MELYKRFRPKTFKGVKGQDVAVETLQRLLKSGTPHAILFSGPSGTGKTTLARIMRSKLECSDIDFREVNSANFRGIDFIRETQGQVGLMPVGGKTRIWLIDECHKLTNDAQNAFLKLLEDPPGHVYFFLCTTDPNKLIEAVKNRCTHIKLAGCDCGSLEALIRETAAKLKKEYKEEVVEKIVELADSSPRRAMVLLEQIMDLDDEDEQLEALIKSDAVELAFTIARLLMDSRTKWPDVSKVLKGIDFTTEDPEGMRRMILGYASKVMIGGGKQTRRAFEVSTEFAGNFFDSGKAGLVSACYQVVVMNKA